MLAWVFFFFFFTNAIFHRVWVHLCFSSCMLMHSTNVLDALKQGREETVAKNELFFFFFSSHGSVVKTRRNIKLGRAGKKGKTRAALTAKERFQSVLLCCYHGFPFYIPVLCRGPPSLLMYFLTCCERSHFFSFTSHGKKEYMEKY